MESLSECTAAHLTTRIRWSLERIRTLLEISQAVDEAELRGRARVSEIQRRWAAVHPDLPSRYVALLQQLRRQRKLGASHVYQNKISIKALELNFSLLCVVLLLQRLESRGESRGESSGESLLGAPVPGSPEQDDRLSLEVGNRTEPQVE